MALPVAAGLKRVDRHHLVARRHQRPDQQPTVQLDADHDLGWLAGVVSDQPMQLGDPGDSIRHPPAAQHRPGGVQHAHLVWASAQSTPTKITWPPLPRHP